MTVQEFMDYLQEKPKDEELHIIIANPERRVRYKCEQEICITDSCCICFKVGEPIPFDAEETRVAEECEKENK